MKKFYLLLLAAILLVPCLSCGNRYRVECCGGQNSEGNEVGGFCKGRFVKAEKRLSRQEAAAAMAVLEKKWFDETKKRYSSAIENKVIEYNDLKLKFAYRICGEKPADGRSLYISMHGGGSVAASDNDSQWRNQINLYTPSEGVYVAPRAPWDAWNMWFQDGLCELFEQLIQAAVVYWDVNPDKVYLMGYSAGGDGAYKMSPRMADRWAAASMMAGHPNGVSMLNLRNTPFMIWMGANDSSFNRNGMAAEYGKLLDDLQANDPGGYIHETHIVADKGHWMDLEDAAALPWMAKYVREPYPDKVVWCQDDVARMSFYWLAIDKCDYKNGATVIAERKGNVIDITQCDYPKITIYLNDAMCNLDKPVTVRYKGRKIYKGRVARTEKTMSNTLFASGDLRYMFPAAVEVKIP